ncbi:hypothetical protein [Streptomyces aureocirculatus]|uniref:hypothetical protein n=1 Tax=Streptomyces aureocirculatus TaxID=67275 RepID=UPI001B80964E|nr:hypothetical protein [Streptomyces aureocirculatus]
MGDQDDAVAEKRDTGSSGHEAFLQLDVGDAPFELGAVFEEPGQALVDVRAAAVRVGGDPAGRFAR